MDSPQSFAQSLAQRLREAGKSQSDLARWLGVDPSIVNKMINGRRSIKTEEAEAIVDFLRGQFVMSTTAVPVSHGMTSAFLVGIVEAGTFRETEPFDDLEFDESRMLPAAVDDRFPNARLLMWEVAGDSMDRLLPRPILAGDRIVAVAYEDVAHQAPMRDGMVVVVQRTRDGGLTREWSVKQVELHQDRTEYHPRSSNTKHKPIVVPKNLDADDGVSVEVIAVVRQVLNQIPLG